MRRQSPRKISIFYDDAWNIGIMYFKGQLFKFSQANHFEVNLQKVEKKKGESLSRTNLWSSPWQLQIEYMVI